MNAFLHLLQFNKKAYNASIEETMSFVKLNWLSKFMPKKYFQ